MSVNITIASVLQAHLNNSKVILNLTTNNVRLSSGFWISSRDIFLLLVSVKVKRLILLIGFEWFFTSYCSHNSELYARFGKEWNGNRCLKSFENWNMNNCIYEIKTLHFDWNRVLFLKLKKISIVCCMFIVMYMWIALI